MAKVDPDVFRPTLTYAPKLGEPITDEQWMYIQKVLEVSSSDSKFAQKAFEAIRYIIETPETQETKSDTTVSVRQSEVNPSPMQDR